MKKLRNIFGNSVWQMMPSVFTLLLSLAVVRLFNASVWGIIVSIIVVQQMASSIISWGNKDFLQRELANRASDFDAHFCALLAERFLLFVAVVAFVYLSGFVASDYFIAFVCLVFGRYLQQSFDILIIESRKFRLAIVLELSFLILQLVALFILRGKDIDITMILAIFWIPALIKSILLFVVFRSHFTLKFPNQLTLPKASFFALLSITGLVHSKIDVLLVSKMLDPQTLAHYQIIMAFLWNIQSAAMYISGPYVHNFYRLNADSRKNYAHWLLRLGLLIVPLGVMVTVILLHLAFQIQVGWTVIFAALLFSSVSFIYLPWILDMNSRNRESRVLLINIAGTLVLIASILLVRAFYGLTLDRLLWIVTIQQIFLTIAAFVTYKNRKAWKLF